MAFLWKRNLLLDSKSRASAFADVSCRLLPIHNVGVRKVQQTSMKVSCARWELRHLFKIQQEQGGVAAPKHNVKDKLMRSEKHLNSEMQYLLTLLNFYQQNSNLERKLSCDTCVWKAVKSFSVRDTPASCQSQWPWVLSFLEFLFQEQEHFLWFCQFNICRGVFYEEICVLLAKEQLCSHILPGAQEKGMESSSIFVCTDQTA